MAILPITVYGDDILRKQAKKIDNIDGKLLDIINDMFETMYNADGIGLAANQVGLDKSIFVIDVSPVEGFEKLKPMVFINPEIIYKSDETDFMKEGCLSVPYIQGQVERPVGITIKYLDINGNEQLLERDDFLARVIQHEYDHLMGVLFTDKVNKRDKSKISKELIKIARREIETHYPITDKERKLFK
ncbi:MAG TPA: peptide deformylase [Ignavibacteriales bacterium]|nr:peptide deformylase [Ignavibacteriales bacterium]HOL82109.1 peptide deformylase [Ignavibacteriales bacterium]HOM65085.1 peptide deformylase [Ignavibacteriales bacterium]HPD68214.1 peptide deformylase [Ignavibacteriales bacterium]HPP34331.1 peptide deformylase [Ignavibacteriales bacterium]